MTTTTSLLSAAAVCLLLAVTAVHCSVFQIEVEVSREICLREELASDTLITADYDVSPGYNLQLFIKVEDPHRAVIWSDNDAKSGQFALTTHSAGEYSFCFLDMPRAGHTLNPGSKRLITFNQKSGLAAKDYGDVAKKEHLEPLELELRKMEDLVEELNAQLQYFRSRDFEARNTSESTNSRVIWYGIISTGILVFLGIAQIYSFWAYLKKKQVLN